MKKINQRSIIILLIPCMVSTILLADDRNTYKNDLKEAAVKVVELNREQRVLIQADDYKKYYGSKKEIIWDIDEALTYALLVDEVSAYDNLLFTLEKNSRGSYFVTFKPETGIMKDKSKQKDVEKSVKDIVECEKVKTLKSDFEKVQWVYDYIKKTCSYVRYAGSRAPSTFNNAWSALNEEQTLCHGYTLLAKAFFNEIGIENQVLGGKVFEKGSEKNFSEKYSYFYYEMHAWNLVKVDGKWYHFDVTFGDNSSEKEPYFYMLKGSDSFKDIRTWMSLEPLPEIESSDYIYK